MQKFKQIENFEAYEVGNFGDIKNQDGSIKKAQITNSGYCLVHLNVNGKRSAKTVHRIVAYHFCNPPENYMDMFVDHIDNNKQNNRYDNLRWVTIQENNRFAWDNGLHEKTRELARERMKAIGKKYAKQNGLKLSGLNKSIVKVKSIDFEMEYGSFREAEKALGLDRKEMSKHANKSKPYKGYIITRIVS